MPEVRLFIQIVCPRDISNPSLFSPTQRLSLSPNEVLHRSIMQGQRPSDTRQAVCKQSFPRQLYSRTHNGRLKFHNKYTRSIATGMQKP